MVTDGGNKVIHRKARASREEYQARAMSPAKAIRLALAQTSDTHFDLPMVVTTVEQVELSQTALRPEFDGGGLLVLLDGPKGARGAARLDEALLAALIEVQTTGRISGRPPSGRAVTRTDAAIAAPLIDITLERAGAQLSEETPDHWATGFQFGVMMEDARGMTLALNAAAFHVFRMTVEMGEAALPGRIVFLLPVPATPVKRPAEPGEEQPQHTLEQSAMNAPVCMDAVLARLSVPLTQLCQLAPGDVLPFHMDRPLQIRLETSQKHVVALGRLGQMNGMRAVRLTPSGDENTAARPLVEAVQAGTGAAVEDQAGRVEPNSMQKEPSAPHIPEPATAE
ncbi:FliM/FliN family flagellar motor switch protein [Roseovarius dicentrarchi]|uniref:FliM/FliN family flagellar motor switch protein n=1 Tax=Roseovarius dicentrarchi TaxID=2250573 RepID=UPI000DE8D218|nr:flagellar motor switch protein FliM [Roseovarius dicentrarchi]